MPLQTPFTKKLSLSHPLVLAPMGGVADGTLAGATAATGGLGFIALSPYKAGWLESELKKAGHIAGEKGALGVGWITWLLVSLPESERQAMLDLALSNPRVKALWFSFGEHSSLVPLIRAKRPDILIFHQLHSASEAVRSLERGTADVIVAQGTESGGHGRLDGTGTGGLVLLPEIVRAVRSFESKHGKPHIPVLATGGLTVPSQVAATLLLGADACVLGTRLMVCKESPLRAEWKAKIVQAKESQETARTLLYDRMKWGAMEQGWEKLGYDGRVLANEVTRSYNSTPEIQKELVAQLEREGGSGKLGAERDPLWAGMGVGMITASDSVAQAIDEIVKGAEDVLLGASKLVVGKL